jgi:hypothetical protein
MRQATKVLLAEDEPNLCRYLVKLMDDMNCEIAVEHNGEDAIRGRLCFNPILRSLVLSCRESMEVKLGSVF